MNLICWIRGEWWSLKHFLSTWDATPIEGHLYREMKGYRRHGKYFSILKCDQCGHSSKGWWDE